MGLGLKNSKSKFQMFSGEHLKFYAGSIFSFIVMNRSKKLASFWIIKRFDHENFYSFGLLSVVQFVLNPPLILWDIVKLMKMVTDCSCWNSKLNLLNLLARISVSILEESLISFSSSYDIYIRPGKEIDSWNHSAFYIVESL